MDPKLYRKKKPAYRLSFSQQVVLCYQSFPYRARKEQKQDHEEVREFFWKGGRVFQDHSWTWISGLGVGAPAMALCLEELAQMGVKRLITLGSCGALKSSGLQAGDVIWIQEALSGEGVSSYYGMKYGQWIRPPGETLQEVLKKAFESVQLTYHERKGWTTDAPYRLTGQRLKELEEQDVSIIDMEASGIFAVSRALNMEAQVLCVVSDLLSEDEWQPCFHHKIVKKNLSSLASLWEQEALQRK